MANEFVQTMADARVDARSLSEFMYRPTSSMVERRLAPSIHTLNYYIDLLDSVAINGEAQINQAIINSGFIIIDSFELGATITQRNQALRHAADGRLYRWAGDLPKVVPASSTPTSSGGIGTNAWLEVSDIAKWQIIDNKLASQKISNTEDLADVPKNRVAYLDEHTTYAYNPLLDAINDGWTINGWTPQRDYALLSDFGYPTVTADVAANLLIASSAPRRLKLTGAITLGVEFNESFEVFGDAVVSQSLLNKAAIKVIPKSSLIRNYNVVESLINFGVTSFNVVGVHDIKVGDFVVIHAGNLRPTDSQPVNFETREVKAVSGSVITIEGAFWGYFSGTITVQVSTPIQGFKISGIKLAETAGTTFNGAIRISHVKDSVVDLVDAVKTIDVTQISHTYCINPKVTNINIKGNRDGKVYGVAFWGCTNLKAENLHGDGTRHIFDADSCYHAKVFNVTEKYDTSCAVTLFHNGFGDDFLVRAVDVEVTKQYAVGASSQGIAGDSSNYAKRSVVIEDVSIGESLQTTQPSGVYIQVPVNASIRNVTIDKVAGNTSPAIRINGSYVADNITTTATLFTCIDKDTKSASFKNSKCKILGISRGRTDISLDNVKYETGIDHSWTADFKGTVDSLIDIKGMLSESIFTATGLTTGGANTSNLEIERKFAFTNSSAITTAQLYGFKNIRLLPAGSPYTIPPIPFKGLGLKVFCVSTAIVVNGVSIPEGGSANFVSNGTAWVDY